MLKALFSYHRMSQPTNETAILFTFNPVKLLTGKKDFATSLVWLNNEAMSIFQLHVDSSVNNEHSPLPQGRNDEQESVSDGAKLLEASVVFTHRAYPQP